MRALLLFIMLLVNPSWADQSLTLGVYAYLPKPEMQQRYQPLTDYLNASLHGTHITLRVLEPNEMEEAIDRHQLDLLLTNPSHYLVVRSRNSLTGTLVTQLSKANGHVLYSMGGVIVARSGDRTINKLADLAGKRIAAPSPLSLGGYQSQLLELHDAGVKLPDPAQVLFAKTHDATIDAVLKGQADVGFIRTGVIERLQSLGQVNLHHLKIINPQNLAGYPMSTSTRLYPEWPMIALTTVDHHTLRNIVHALLALEDTHPAAQAAQIAGFTTAADYSSVEHLARALRLAPYDIEPEVTIADIWHGHWPEITAILFGMLNILLLSVILARRNKTLAKAHKSVESAYTLLEQERVFLKSLINTLPDLIFLKNDEGVYLACNTTFEQLYGKPESEIIGKTDYDFVDKELADFFRKNDKIAMEKDAPSVNEEWLTFASDGHRALHETTKTPMKDKNGLLIGILGIAHDITERMHFEEQLKQSSEIIDMSPFIAVRWENAPGWPVSFISRNIEQFGYSAEDFLTNAIKYETLIHPDDLPAIQNDVADHLAHGPDSYRQTYRLRHGNGHWIWVEDRTWLTRDGKGTVTAINGIITDITDRELDQKKIRAQLDELQRWQSIMVSSEERVLDLKREVNALLLRLNEAPRYGSAASQDKDA